MGQETNNDNTPVQVTFDLKKSLLASELGYGEGLPITGLTITANETVGEVAVEFISTPHELMNNIEFYGGNYVKGQSEVFTDKEIIRSNVKFNRDFLEALTDKLECEIYARVTKNREELGRSKAYRITVYPLRWLRSEPIHLESICCFVDRSDPLVTQRYADIFRDIVSEAIDLQAGYRGNDATKIKRIISSAYNSIVKLGLNEKTPKAIDGFSEINKFSSIGITHQCSVTESALILASLFHSLRLRTLFACLKDGRILVGAWTTFKIDDEKHCTDSRLILNKTGTGDIIFLDPSGIFGSSGFTEVSEDAAKLIADNSKDIAFVDLIDAIDRRRKEFGEPLYSGEIENGSVTEGDFLTSGPVGRGKLGDWMASLLDFNASSDLLSVNVGQKVPSSGKFKKFPLLVLDINEFVNGLLSGNVYNIIAQRPEGLDIPETVIPYLIYQDRTENPEKYSAVFDNNTFAKDKKLYMPFSKEKSDKALISLFEEEKLTTVRKIGINPVYLAIDLIKWIDDKGEVRYAPFILLPVDLKQVGVEDEGSIEIGKKYDTERKFTLAKAGEPLFNNTFFEKQRSTVFFQGDKFDMDKSLDLPKIEKALRDAVRLKNWGIVPSLILGSFSYSDYVMWKDLADNGKALRDNKLVRSLIDGVNLIESKKIVNCDFYPEVHLTSSADGSQMSAVKAALSGESFVLHGPPGTGKSQTIANIISNLLMNGKTVLFVAEKPTALNVVYQRLTNKEIWGDHSLEPFCLMVNADSMANPHRILVKLNDTAKNIHPLPSSEDKDRSTLEEEYAKLADDIRTYKDSIYGPAYFGKGFRPLVNEYYGLDQTLEKMELDDAPLSEYPSGFLDDLKQLLDGLTIDRNGMNLGNFALEDSKLTVLTSEDVTKILRLAKEFKNQMNDLEKDNLLDIVWYDRDLRNHILGILSRFKHDLDQEQLNYFMNIPELEDKLDEGRFFKGYSTSEALESIQRENDTIASIREEIDRISECYSVSNTELEEGLRGAEKILKKLDASEQSSPLAKLGIKEFRIESDNTLEYWNRLSEGFRSDMARTLPGLDHSSELIYEFNKLGLNCKYLVNLGVKWDFAIDPQHLDALSVRFRVDSMNGVNLGALIKTLKNTPKALSAPLLDHDLHILEKYNSALSKLANLIFLPPDIDTFVEKVNGIYELKHRITDKAEHPLIDLFDKKDSKLISECNERFSKSTGQNLTTFLMIRRKRIVEDFEEDLSETSEASTTETESKNNYNALWKDTLGALKTDSEKLITLRTKLINSDISDHVCNNGKLISSLADISNNNTLEAKDIYRAWTEMDTYLMDIDSLLDEIVSDTGDYTKIVALNDLLASVITTAEVLKGSYDFSSALTELANDTKALANLLTKDTGWREAWLPIAITCDELAYLDLKKDFSELPQSLFKRKKAEIAFVAKYSAPSEEKEDGAPGNEPFLMKGVSFEKAATTMPEIAEIRLRMGTFLNKIRFTYSRRIRLLIVTCTNHMDQYSQEYTNIDAINESTYNKLRNNTDFLEYCHLFKSVESEVSSILNVPLNDWPVDLVSFMGSHLVKLLSNLEESITLYHEIDEDKKKLSTLAIPQEETDAFLEYLKQLSETDRIFTELGAYEESYAIDQDKSHNSIFSEIKSGKLKNTVVSLYNGISSINNNLIALKKSHDAATSKLDSEYMNKKRELCQLAHHFDEEMFEVANLLTTLYDKGSFTAETFSKLKNLEARIDEFTALTDEIIYKLKLPGDRVHDVDSSRKFLEDLDKSKESILNWVIMKRYKDKFENNHFGTVYDLIYRGKDPELVLRMFHRSIYERAISEHISRNTNNLAIYTNGYITSKLRAFKDKDNELLDNNRKTVYNNLAQRLEEKSLDTTCQEEFKMLDAEVRHETLSYNPDPKNEHPIRHQSLKKVLTNTLPNTLTTLTPCVMMSPIAAAQCLELSGENAFHFDYLIFDEASQIFTSKAVGVLARADNAIIVGDHMQMPPYGDFKSKVDTDDADENWSPDYSVLEDCMHLNLPDAYLRWHYRSEHESLISFSNEMFYAGSGKMRTFPSIDEREKKIKFVYVDGAKFVSNQGNRREAEFVATYLKDILDEGTYDLNQIGILVPNTYQRDLLKEVWNSDIERQTMDVKLPIVTMEEAQGEEYDLVLFSLSFRPEKITTTSRFGKFTNPGGQKRLNVAITRARKEMVVFSSVRSSDFPPEVENLAFDNGLKALAAFLGYAERGGQFKGMTSNDTRLSSYDPIAVQIKEFLEKDARLKTMNYEYDLNIGQSDFKIDLAVRDKNGKYILGILTDGESFRKTENIRDRSFLQEDILKARSWDILRVWTVDWWERHSAIQNAIINELVAVDMARTFNKSDLFKTRGYRCNLGVDKSRLNFIITGKENKVLLGIIVCDFEPDATNEITSMGSNKILRINSENWWKREKQGTVTEKIMRHLREADKQ